MCFFTTGHCKIIKLFSETRDSSHGNQEATIFSLFFSPSCTTFTDMVFFVMVQAFIEPYMTRKIPIYTLVGVVFIGRSHVWFKSSTSFWRSTHRHRTTSKERLSIISTHTPHTSLEPLAHTITYGEH